MKRHARRSPMAQVVSDPGRTVDGCSGMRCYPNAHVARRLAKRMRRHLDVRVDGFRCRHCHAWHIGER